LVVFSAEGIIAAVIRETDNVICSRAPPADDR
jgi:hypothetical protein